MKTLLAVILAFLSYVIVALLFVGWIGHPPFAQYLPWGSSIVGVLGFAFFGAGSYLVLPCALVLILLKRRWWRQCVAASALACIVLFTAPSVGKLGWRLRQDWLKRIATESRPLLNALSAADSDAARERLVSSFTSRSLGGRHFWYSSSGDTWELSLTTPVMFGTTDRFLYRSDQKYPTVELLSDGREDGRYERVAEWAYFLDNDE